MSVLLDSHDVRQALQTHNQMVDDIGIFEKQNHDLKSEIDELK